MQTHCSRPKGFSKIKLNAKKVHKFSIKKLVERSSVFLFSIVVQGLKVIGISKVIGFKVQVWFVRNVLLSLCLLLECRSTFLLISFWEVHCETFVAHPRSLIVKFAIVVVICVKCLWSWKVHNTFDCISSSNFPSNLWYVSNINFDHERSIVHPRSLFYFPIKFAIALSIFDCEQI
jgi:hypothetical protein